MVFLFYLRSGGRMECMKSEIKREANNDVPNIMADTKSKPDVKRNNFLR